MKIKPDPEPAKVSLESTNKKFEEVLQWIKDNPKNAVFYTIGGVIFVYPSLLTVPALAGLGLGPGGAVPATAAPRIASMLGNVKAASWFATLYSAGMNGYGAPIVAGVVRGGVGAAMSFAAVISRLRKRREGPKL